MDTPETEQTTTAVAPEVEIEPMPAEAIRPVFKPQYVIGPCVHCEHVWVSECACAAIEVGEPLIHGVTCQAQPWTRCPSCETRRWWTKVRLPKGNPNWRKGGGKKAREAAALRAEVRQVDPLAELVGARRRKKTD